MTGMGAYEKVKLARDNKRPTATSYIHNIFTEFFEMRGDRRFADDQAVIGGIARLGGIPVTVIATEKGRSTRERMLHSFGAPNPEGYRKSLRLMKQAEKFHRPVICLVDTSGAYCGIGAEERGEGQAIAENLMELMTLKTPVISIVIGEGGSGGALALAVADRVWMLENSIYSIISPEGCASILWKDSAKADQAAEVLELTAQDSLRNGIIDMVISEDDIGEDSYYEGIKELLTDAVKELMQRDVSELTAERYMRFRRIGQPAQGGEEEL